MKRLPIYFLATALIALALAPSASGAFGIKEFDVTYTNQNGSPATQAGSHPWAMTTTLNFTSKTDPGLGEEVADGAAKNLTFELPAGLVGDRAAVPPCSNADFLRVNNGSSECPDIAAIGFLYLRSPGEATGGDLTPVFNLVPPPGTAAKIGFVLANVPVTVAIRVNPLPPYNLIATLQNTSNAVQIGGSTLTVWGNPASPLHDDERGRCLENTSTCEVELPERPFLTLPRSCEGPLPTTYKATSWEEPGIELSGVSASSLQTTGCDALTFGPEISAKPTTERAESASGLDFKLDVDDNGLIEADKNAQSDMKKTVVTLPAGMTVNPSAAAGLSSCSPAQLALESPDSEPGQGCPESSKLGSVEVETKLLENESKEPVVLKGQVFLASQDDPATPQPGAENPFDSMIALYIVIQDRDLGLSVKLAGKVELDPITGQLTTTFGEPGQEIPQFPVSHFRFHFRDGSRAPLVTPPACGSFTIEAALSPWANPAVVFPGASSFPVSSGIGGGPCPAGARAFAPHLDSGSTDNAAGAYSPFNMRFTRNDGEQEITRLDAVLPAGVVGKIAGLAQCSDAAIAAAKAKSGRAELAAPSCPPGSAIGHTEAGAGVGGDLTYVPGSIYLGGPFAGNPLSIVAITPVLAGPFDAGTVVVRQALTLDPVTGEVQIDGSHSDPIPHILKGIPTRLRDLRVYVDRPDFTINPTGCEAKATKASLFGSGADVFSLADDAPASLSSPYWATGCGALKFKPKLSLKLTGGTRRNDHPSLKSVLTYPKGPGYANIAKAVVLLPPSEFIDNAHIQNPCTRVQFAAKQCPKGSVLGTAKAVTPLLDKPLEGPVYFRSNGGERLLPDVVADLNGQFHIVLVGKVDSRKGRIRTTFDQVPDAPVSTFTLSLRGGKKGLLVNSRNLCANKLKASVKLSGQNGKTHDTLPALATSCPKGKAKKPTAHHR